MCTKDTDNIRHACKRTQTHTRNISCESSLIELTPQLTARFTMFRSKMEDWGRNKCWARLQEEADAATLFHYYQTTGSHPPVSSTTSVHSGLKEMEEHYLFIFTHFSITSPRLIPLPSTFASLVPGALPHFSPALYLIQGSFAITFLTFTDPPHPGAILYCCITYPQHILLKSCSRTPWQEFPFHPMLSLNKSLS